MANEARARNVVARQIARKQADDMILPLRLTAALALAALSLGLTVPARSGAQEAVLAQESTPAQEAAPAAAAATADKNVPVRDPTVGEVTKLPLPRFVSLKTNEGNARRGPGLTHRIDWVFTVAGMPLRVTAEYENWRRVEDADGAGGWVHYSLLSSARTVLVIQDMSEFLTKPEAGDAVAFQAEYGVIGRLLECTIDWCRVSVEGEKGWAQKQALWGVSATEIIE